MVDLQSKNSNSVGVMGWLILLLLSLVWGSSYILIKKGLVAFSPIQLACLRVSISSLSLFPFFFAISKRVDWSKLRYLAVVGFCGSFFPSFLFAYAQTELSSSTTGVLSSLTPLSTLLLGILIFGVEKSWIKILGVLIGLGGAIFLIVKGSATGMQGNIWYGGLVVLASILYALSANTVKASLQEMKAFDISVLSYVMIGIPGIIFLLSSGFVEVLTTHEAGWTSLGYIALLSIFGTVLSSILFFKLVHMTNAVFASTVSYLIPLVALMWGMVDGELIEWYHLVGMAAILLGVYISSRKK